MDKKAMDVLVLTFTEISEEGENRIKENE